MSLPLLLLAVVAVLTIWMIRRTVRVVPATLDLEASHEQFHAHADLGDVLIHEGDAVHLHQAPDHIPFGEKRTLQTKATVAHASWPRRILTRILGTSHVTELYEVGFEG
jgi:ABC-type nickel/cobalt efflux system permease component RcnA